MTKPACLLEGTNILKDNNLNVMAQTFYEILGIGQNASEKEIKSAFRALARKHHPDVQGDPAKFREIYEAYETLFDREKRAKYDRLGHEGYSQEGSREVHYPSYEEIFKERVRQMISTETPVDYFVPEYPSSYFGGEGFEDPYTGDLYTSAEDIRIAKMEHAYAMYLEQMKIIKNNFYGELEDLNKLRMLAGSLFNMKWLKEDEIDESLRLIDEYEIKDREYRTERKLSERTQEVGDPIQEKEELK